MEVNTEMAALLTLLEEYYSMYYSNEERGPILQARIDALSETSYWEMWKEWAALEDLGIEDLSLEVYNHNGKMLYDALVTLRDEQLRADREEVDTYNEIQENKYD